ncbi:MAG TPA: hypothetical protein ENN07_03615 [candidate division Zixibacteria bacterium]|nr:hypothetical protein [candidate division Zixibacteria bacterium]
MTEHETVVLEVTFRWIGEMVAEILQNEGIEAHLIGTSFLNTAYLVDSGLLNNDGVGWRLVVPSSQAERARMIIAELEASGKLEDSEIE